MLEKIRGPWWGMFWRYAAVGVGLFVAYVLSLGPVVFFMLATDSFDDANTSELVERVYEPLANLNDHVPGFEAMMNAYVGLWGHLALALHLDRL